MMINLKDNSEKDKYILELFQTSPKEAFRLLFDAYHMKLCIYAVQLTDSFEMAEDIVQDFFIYFWEKKYYLKINQNLRYYRLSGNFWLVSFKISYLCLPLFYETRTTPSCHPSGCAYRQL